MMKVQGVLRVLNFLVLVEDATRLRECEREEVETRKRRFIPESETKARDQRAQPFQVK
jgi:hypothetical protein